MENKAGASVNGELMPEEPRDGEEGKGLESVFVFYCRCDKSLQT